MTTANELLAAKVDELLKPGIMCAWVRRQDWVSLLARTFGRAQELSIKRTSCAYFLGAALIDAGILPKRGWPSIFGITSWLGLGGFSGSHWIRYTKNLVLRPGDVAYWCSNSGSLQGRTWTTWQAALDGHVECLQEGEGTVWSSGGGGSSLTGAEAADLRRAMLSAGISASVAAARVAQTSGTVCRLHPARDITKLRRPLQGVWRPDGAQSAPRTPQEPLDSKTPPRLPIRPGDRGDGRVRRWQLRLQGAGYPLAKAGADDWYGTSPTSETGVATCQVQAAAGLPINGIVDLATWDAARPLHP